MVSIVLNFYILVTCLFILTLMVCVVIVITDQTELGELIKKILLIKLDEKVAKRKEKENETDRH